MTEIQEQFGAITNFYQLNDAIQWAAKQHQAARPKDQIATKDGLWQGGVEVCLPSVVADAEGLVRAFREGYEEHAYMIVNNLATITEYIDNFRRECFEINAYHAGHFWRCLYDAIDLKAILWWYRDECSKHILSSAK